MYTSITGDYDPPRNDVEVFSEYNQFKDPRLNAKIYKILPHLFFDVKYSIWVDGNMFPKISKEELIDLLAGKDIAVIRHSERNCLYKEADLCLATAKNHINPDTQPLVDQVARYRTENFPEGAGLAVCGMLIRRHTDTIKRLNEQWWSEICSGSFRDQVSFPYVFRDHIQWIDGEGNWKDNKYWRLVSHKGISKFFYSLPQPSDS
jgi:hypothetical protein